ncbi:MAG TPA: ATP-grasp domain-containing protein [Spirochaetota bacterium]|nr:ATP-grasp domain-containing protein [Spirochaetota bacterium]
MKPITIAVTGLNAVDSPGPGVPVLRSLLASSLECRLVGLAYDVLEPGIYMPDLVDATFLLPYPNSGPAALIDRIRTIHAKVPLDFIIPTLDAELDNFILVKEQLAEMGIKVFLPGKEQLHLRDKTRLAESLREKGIDVPETVIMGDLAGIRRAMETIQFPFLIKGLFYEAYLASGYEEAVGYFSKVAARWGLPVIAQERIKGEEYNVIALANHGEVVGAVPMKKMYLTDKGKAWAGVTIDNPELLENATKIIREIGWNSGCELEYIKEEKTGRLYLLEINPRFPAWIWLATAAGQNLPEMLIRLANGETPAPVREYQYGKVFVRHSWDDIVDMSEIAMLSGTGEFVRKVED